MPLADRLKKPFAATSDVVFVQAEAIPALEAAASRIVRPDIMVLNIVTSQYGTHFGAWLRRGLRRRQLGQALRAVATVR
ncbi:aspartate aminotransferase-like enzyme [Paraburkholderia sp. GAS33]